jgi:hypothetical protein
MDTFLRYSLPLCIAWALLYLSLFAVRKHLPFFEAEIIEVDLSASPNRPMRSRLLVRLRLPGEAAILANKKLRARVNTLTFYLKGSPDEVRGDRKYRRLESYFEVEKYLKFCYAPHLVWLFGVVPDLPGIPPNVVEVAGLALLFGSILGILYIY